jgi:erythromycin esterase-like protein
MGLFGRNDKDHDGDADDAAALAALRAAARPLAGRADDHAPLLDMLGGARFALLGEASHGTHEFYFERAEITKRLIVERRFDAVAVEADWPDAYRVNRYVRGLAGIAGTPRDAGADAALAGFKRFPTWMWRNTVVRDFVEWLRGHNAKLAPAARVGFYGIDLYSLFTSIEAVLGYLGRVDPEAAERARRRYACFDRFREDTQAYGYAAALDLGESCENGVVAQLVELTRRAGAAPPGGADPDAHFAAEQNARLVKNAEHYYRSMFRGRVSSWNLRDAHMVETLLALDAHLGRQRAAPPRIAVWAHNSHLGDASQTEMGEDGEWNVGQLMRERHGADALLVGFTTHHGTVTAASDWDSAAETKTVRPGLAGSCEALLHDVGIERFGVLLRGDGALARALDARRLQRAIGVIYRPETERQSHYFHARMARQFDALVHLDETHALQPLDRPAAGGAGEAPETFPSGL